MEELNSVNSKKRLKVYYSLLITVVCIIGVSFAWFRLYLSQSNKNEIATRTCFSTTLTEDTSKIELTDAFPISDEDGLKQTPFTFTLKNNCDSYVKVYITISSTYRTSTDSSYLKDDYVKVNVSPKDKIIKTSELLSAQTLTDLENDNAGYILVETGLKANEEKTYDLRVWMDSNTTLEQGLNKNWAGKIVVITDASKELAPAPDGWYEASSDSLLGSLRKDNVLKTPLTIPGQSISSSDEALLASTSDDYGTSYYFRGDVENNYVLFANKCWRIVRVTGDGSIKMVLYNDNVAGTNAPCSSANDSTDAAFAHYNGSKYVTQFNKSNSDNAYIGFMYGTVGASDYASTHANKNKSTILTNLETWYKNNLVSYTDELADTIWCNDKSTIKTLTSGITNRTGLGYGKNETNYGTYNRIYGGGRSYSNPSLICPDDDNGGKLSKFTVNDVVNGNGDLSYKIGLLTADELAFSGFSLFNYFPGNYLIDNATEEYWWTMSPCYGPAAIYANFDTEGSAEPTDYSNDALRPAISLVSDITISGGSGTSENPYIVN